MNTTKQRTRRAKLAGLLVGAGMLTSGLVAGAPAAIAATTVPYVSTPSADMFWCTSRQALCTSQTVTRVPQYTHIELKCWRDDRDPFNPNGTSRWFYSVLANGQEGYLWSAQVYGDALVAPTPACSTVNWINVADFAIGHDNGQITQWTSGDGPYIPNRPGNYWSGWCLAFAADTWVTAGGATTRVFAGPQTAIASWNSWTKKGQYDNVHRPPRGALVYFNWTSAGHVAISLGNWRAVSTQGDSPQTLPIYDFSFSPATPGYLGWVMPVRATGATQNIN